MGTPVLIGTLINGISADEKGAPEGVAVLDAGARVPDEQMPERLDAGGFSQTVADAVSEEGPAKDALSAAFVQFRDQNGDPLPAGSVTTIVINTTTGDIDDIIFEEA